MLCMPLTPPHVLRFLTTPRPLPPNACRAARELLQQAGERQERAEAHAAKLMEELSSTDVQLQDSQAELQRRAARLLDLEGEGRGGGGRGRKGVGKAILLHCDEPRQPCLLYHASRRRAAGFGAPCTPAL